MNTTQEYTSPQVIRRSRTSSNIGAKTTTPCSHQRLADFSTSAEKMPKQPARWNKETVKQLLRERFKDFYESPSIADLKEKRSKSTRPEKNETLNEHRAKSKEQSKERSVSALSVASSKCSQCSGCSREGMEYVCVNCLNGELECERRGRMNREIEREQEEDAERLQKIEELRKKCELELAYLKRIRNKEMNEGMRIVEEKRAKKRLIEYHCIETLVQLRRRRRCWGTSLE
eukprot:TRINITY_DN12915_c0_g1_i5.p1 TRINITY_DN12915_c0_g1~~TRINITY_DN12915_c0_g1_i5.p1  ORF type:complete len:231 (+),score=37.75 TRINITY_DN12915_c0_g1_i5:202-894(+)